MKKQSTPNLEKSSKAKKLLLIAVVLLVLLAIGGSVWAVRQNAENRRTEAQVAEVKEMGKDLFNPETMKDLTPEEAREKFTALREKADQLPKDQQDKLRQEGMRQMMIKPAQEYCALPPDQREAYLDKKIADMEAMGKMFRAMRALGGGGAGGQGGPGGAGGPPGANQRPDPNTDPAGFAKWEADRDSRRREWLNRLTPVERAQMDTFRQAMTARREALGLPAWGGRGPGGAGGGRGAPTTPK